MKYILPVLLALFIATSTASAHTWISETKVYRIGTYTQGTTHFVWFTNNAGTECQGSTLHFDENVGAGKTLMSVLLAALLSDRPLDVQTHGCEIIEVYIR